MTINLQPIIGLEIHLQLNTKSKVFCGCSAQSWKAAPNTHVCPVCLGLPGAIPTLNKNAIEASIRMALALNCKITDQSYFERKNYFYPDLPKGYQISQKRAPLSTDGFLEVGGERIAIWEIHLEEDTAKSLHHALDKSRGFNKGEGITFLDFNKSGIPLLEMVSAPEIHSIEVMDAYAKEVREIARVLGISDCDMEKGQMRFEANVSMQRKPTEEKSSGLGLEGRNSPEPGSFPSGPKRTNSEESAGWLPNYRVEIKNLNSFKHLRDAVAYEIKRQTKLIQAGREPDQETRGWDLEKRQTFVQRSKEDANDYRYFPEPDLPGIQLSAVGPEGPGSESPGLSSRTPQSLALEPGPGKDDLSVEELRKSIPELPGEKRKRLVKMGLTVEQVEILVKDKKREEFAFRLAESIDLTEAVKLVINRPEIMQKSPEKALEELKKGREEVVSDVAELEKVAWEVIEANPDPVADYKSGKETTLQFLIGQMMNKTRGQADPKVAANCLKRLLG